MRHRNYDSACCRWGRISLFRRGAREYYSAAPMGRTFSRDTSSLRPNSNTWDGASVALCIDTTSWPAATTRCWTKNLFPRAALLWPQARVKDYFVGDGLTTRFHLSQIPFTKSNLTLVSEEYTTATLDPTRWSVTDPASAVSVSGGKLQVAGGNGNDGATTVSFVEKIEMSGATILQHGDVVFNS